MAAEEGHVDIVKYLIQQGVQVDAKNKVRIDVYNMSHA